MTDISHIFRPLIEQTPGQPDPTSGDAADLIESRGDGMITRNDMERQVSVALDGREDEFDVDGIVNEIHETYGLVDIEGVEPVSFWRFVQAHALQNWYFTFGVGHPLFPKKYVKIHGTHEGARKIMFAVFGRNWSHQYAEDRKAECIYRYGLTELQ